MGCFTSLTSLFQWVALGIAPTGLSRRNWPAWAQRFQHREQQIELGKAPREEAWDVKGCASVIILRLLDRVLVLAPNHQVFFKFIIHIHVIASWYSDELSKCIQLTLHQVSLLHQVYDIQLTYPRGCESQNVQPQCL